MLGTVEEIDYDGDRVRKVILRFPALRAGDAEVTKEVRACERIGQGSFGTVYRAVCEDYPRLALKISTGKSTRLRQELDVLSRVCTKGRLLLPRFEFGALNKTADLIVIGMELCVPSTLHDLLLSTRITSEAEMLFMAYQVVQAVSYVHEEGCIHRDIKLQNFVFDLDGNLKLIDFGLACNSLSPPAGDVVAGTVSFMSPEMAHNALHKDKRVSVGVAADVWSLGIVLFSIFTQRNPYPPPPTTTTESGTQRGGSGGSNSNSNFSANGEAAHREASTSHPGTSGSTSATSKNNNNNNNATDMTVAAQQRMNERLLRRVAAGDWQWPVGVHVSQDLKQLVNSILITNPEKRPTVRQILQNKLWNLRRRYPPAAVAAFLGVQDDFLLSHDEAHLMRAVEERSAGVTASLLQNRVESPETSNASAKAGTKSGVESSSGSSTADVAARRARGGRSRSGAEQNEPRDGDSIHGGDQREDEAGDALGQQDLQQQQHVSGTTTPPVRSSLKVVQRGGEGGGVDGAVAVQVYDVRASTRKRSKPIREISVVMAEETAKRRQSKTRGRQRKNAAGGVFAASAPASRRPSPLPSATREDAPGFDLEADAEEPRRASSAGATLQRLPSSAAVTPVMILDDASEDEERAGEEVTKGAKNEVMLVEDGEGSARTSDGAVEVVAAPRGDTVRSTAASASRSRPRQTSGGRKQTSSKRASVAVEDTRNEEEEREEEQLLPFHNTGSAAQAAANNSADTFASYSVPTNSSFTPPLLSSFTVSSPQTRETGGVEDEGAEEVGDGQRAGSVELVGPSQGDELRTQEAALQRQSSASRKLASTDRRTTSSKRPRDTSLHQTSSSIFHGVTRPLSRSRPTTPTLKATSTAPLEAAPALPVPAKEETLLTSTSSQDLIEVLPARPVGRPRGTKKSSSAISAAAASAPSAQPSGSKAATTTTAPTMTRSQRIALELSLSVLMEDEADRRRYLGDVLLLEHAWLLASFRLTIEEDQERYFITWLAEEQAMSASHPHRFKEMTRVTNKQYANGFVCDMCDYEFLPTGADKKDLHYFHCPCGRDLCPDCYEEYRRQCTCSCCRLVHPNSHVLGDHLRMTGGHQLYGGLKGVTRSTAASLLDSPDSYEGTPASTQRQRRKAGQPSTQASQELSPTGGVAPRRRGRPRRSDTPVTVPSRSSTSASHSTPSSVPTSQASQGTSRRRGRSGVDVAAAAAAAALDIDADTDALDEGDELAHVHLPRMSVAAMQQERVEADAFADDGLSAPRGRGRGGRGGGGRGGRGRGSAPSGVTAAPHATAAPPQRPEDVEVKQRAVEQLPEGPWRPFARFKKDRTADVARQPTPEERDALLNGDWIRYFYLFPSSAPEEAAAAPEDPYAFVYHAQPGRTGAVFLTSDFPMHSAVFSMLERQFFVVDQVDTVDGADATRATSLLRAKAQPDLKIAFQALQDIVAYDTNMMKQQRTPGTVSVYQAPRSAYSCNGEPFLYVRWFRFNEDRSLSAFLLSNGAVQVFVNNEYELRWFDEQRKFLIRYNGVCELVEDSTFALAPAINHLLYDSFDA